MGVIEIRVRGAPCFVHQHTHCAWLDFLAFRLALQTCGAKRTTVNIREFEAHQCLYLKDIISKASLALIKLAWSKLQG